MSDHIILFLFSVRQIFGVLFRRNVTTPSNIARDTPPDETGARKSTRTNDDAKSLAVVTYPSTVNNCAAYRTNGKIEETGRVLDFNDIKYEPFG